MLVDIAFFIGVEATRVEIRVSLSSDSSVKLWMYQPCKLYTSKWNLVRICTNLCHNDDLITGKVELLDGLSKENLRGPVGVDLITLSYDVCIVYKGGGTHVCRIECLDTRIISNQMIRRMFPKHSTCHKRLTQFWYDGKPPPRHRWPICSSENHHKTYNLGWSSRSSILTSPTELSVLNRAELECHSWLTVRSHSPYEIGFFGIGWDRIRCRRC